MLATLAIAPVIPPPLGQIAPGDSCKSHLSSFRNECRGLLLRAVLSFPYGPPPQPRRKFCGIAGGHLPAPLSAMFRNLPAAPFPGWLDFAVAYLACLRLRPANPLRAAWHLS